jgi:hypothetical protein
MGGCSAHSHPPAGGCTDLKALTVRSTRRIGLLSLLTALTAGCLPGTDVLGSETQRQLDCYMSGRDEDVHSVTSQRSLTTSGSVRKDWIHTSVGLTCHRYFEEKQARS